MIDIRDCAVLMIEGVDTKDYPDFVDAYFSFGMMGGRELTDDELEYLTKNYPEVLNQVVMESLR